MVAKCMAARMAALAIPMGLAAALCTCAAPLTPGQRMRETAHEYALSVRFGRVDMAIERVSPGHRRDFALQHAAWGGGLRIVDCELTGIAVREPGHAEAILTVGWQRVDESDVRTTQIVQRWRDLNGSWVLEGEERAAGDVGLLGEPKVQVAPRPPTGHTQFESVTIRGQSP